MNLLPAKLRLGRLRYRIGTLAVAISITILSAWWKWPYLSQCPGIQPIVEWYAELTPMPLCNGKKFCVAVAQFQNDSAGKFEDRLVGEMLRLQQAVNLHEGQGNGVGIEVIRLPRLIATTGNKTRDARAKARGYLEQSHADLIIWGSIRAEEKTTAARIFWTTRQVQQSSDLLNIDSGELADSFWQQLAAMLQLVVTIQHVRASEEGDHVVDKLRPFIEKTRALLPETQGPGWTTDSRAQVKLTLANALSSYGEQAGNRDAIEESIAYYHEVLQEWTRERDPLNWALTEDDLGIALDNLGESEGGTADLQQAVNAYQQALLERTRDRAPLDWAETENNLGAALEGLGRRESSVYDLERAVDAYEQALLERTRDLVPLDWATTENNLGNALEGLGEQESGTDELQRAVFAFQRALQGWTRKSVPFYWAEAESNIGYALVHLGEREAGTAELQRAVDAYQLALLELSRQHDPFAWALTESNLCNALNALGKREAGTADFQKSVDACQQALLEWTREGFPFGWATAENNLGNVFHDFGQRDKDSVQLCSALQAHMGAWQVFQETSPRDAAIVRNGVQADVNTISKEISHGKNLQCLTHLANTLEEMRLSMPK